MNSSRHPQAAPVFFEGLELMRAVLILLVIVGHALVGAMNKEPLRFAIYSFHMPLFLALSGFVLNRQRLVEAPWLEFFRHYIRRMLFAWLIAAAFFMAVCEKGFWEKVASPTSDLLNIFLYPAYHLWFIPALLLQIVLLRFLERRLPPSARAAVLMTAAAAALFLFWSTKKDGPDAAQPVWLNLMGDKRWILFFVYFYLGFFLRHWKPSASVMRWVVALAIPGLLLGAGIRFEDWKESMPMWEARLGGLLMCSGLALFSFWWLAPASMRIPVPVRWLSEQCLFLYLWHVPVIRGVYAEFPVLRKLPGNAGEFVVAALAVLVLFLVWVLLRRFAWAGLWFGFSPARVRPAAG